MSAARDADDRSSESRSPRKVDQQPAQFHYVALDLDGTLLNKQHQVSSSTAEYLRGLDAKGFGILIATGRALDTVYDTIIALNIPRPIPVLCSNGAKAVLCQPDPSCQPTGVATTPLFELPVPELVARRTIQLAKEMGFLSQYYLGNGGIYADPTTETNYHYVNLYKTLTGAKTIVVDDMMEVLEAKGLPTKQLVLFPKECQDQAMEMFEQTFRRQPEYWVEGQPATLVRGYLGWFLEILPPNVCKGYGLQRLCQQHLPGIDLTKHIVAFGDGDNDLEFLQMAAWGVGMANARPIIQQKAADQVIPWTNEEDGVRKTLQLMEQAGQLVFSNQKQTYKD